jgi:hypothetical protein
MNQKAEESLNFRISQNLTESHRIAENLNIAIQNRVESGANLVE